MTDKTIPDVTDHDRRLAYEWAKSVESATNPWSDRTLAVARVLLAVLPKPPTLADMTDEEREECQWMQADVKELFGRCVITYPCDDDGYVGVVSDSGWPELLPAHLITPRPDLPRLEWPTDEGDTND